MHTIQKKPKSCKWFAKIIIIKYNKVMKFIESLNPEIQKYLSLLSPDFPDWLEDYILTPELQRINKISIACGWDYSTYYGTKYFYSNLYHSIGVALIVWNFTHDKKQTLSGLFHDIATPVFKHCIDFMNGDAETQESTEDKTYDIIAGSEQIMKLLKRDKIKIEEVADYHQYPVADNDTPRLSADRLEYTFSTGLVEKRLWSLEKISECYNDLTLCKNEEGITELCFKTKEVAENFVKTASKLWPLWTDEKDKAFMQFLADICGSMNKAGYLKIDDLYILSEKEVVDKILNCPDNYLATAMKNFVNGKEVIVSESPLSGRYCVKMKSKIRYIIPLVKCAEKSERLNKISVSASKIIEDFLSKKFDKWGCLDFDFKPY